MLTKYWIRLVAVLILFTTMVQIGGLVSPLWIYLEANNVTIGVGLYYRIGCGASTEGNCTTAGFSNLPFGYNSTATYDEMSWMSITGLETASAALAVILSLMMVIYLVGFGVWRKMNALNTAMVVVCILSWLTLIAGLIVYIVFYGKVITRSPDVSPQSFPWSPLICLVAAIFFFIITFLIRFRCRNRNYVKNAIPTSTDSKLALNPSTKNQLMRRYFTPSPYREDRRQALYASGNFNDQSHLLGNGFTAGAIEQSTGVENMGFSNIYSRAIEYNVSDRANGSALPVIETNTLPVGTYVGSTTAAVNGGYRASVRDRDLSSLVNHNNNTGTYGTEVVKRTLVTRTVGENTYGTEVDQRRNAGYQPDVAYQPEVRGVNSQSVDTYQQGHRAEGQVLDQRIPQNDSVFGNTVTLNQTRGYDAFSDIDTETVYYTGREGFKPIVLGRESFIRNSTRNTTSGGWGSSYGMRQSLQPVKEEQTIETVTVTERAGGKVATQGLHFRYPADHNVTTGVQKAADYTVHTRTFTDNQAVDQVVQTPGQLSGKKFAYNGTYIYRPYSESSY